MHPMPTVSIHRPEFQGLLLNGCPSRDRCGRIAASWMMAMDSKLNPTMNDKKEQVSVQVSTPSIPKVETLRSGHLHFDRLQPSDQELLRENRFEFGQFVAREAALDEEYWTAAWLRAESHWEDRTFERYIDNYKRKFAEQEYNAVKRRCRGQNGNSCTCIIMVKKEQKNVKCSVLKSVVGTLDLNIRLLLQGETFPGVLLHFDAFKSVVDTNELLVEVKAASPFQDLGSVLVGRAYFNALSLLGLVLSPMWLEGYPKFSQLLSRMPNALLSFLQERVKAPLFCNINRKPPIRYGYIANLCVAKSARRKGIASNMLYFAVESARSNGNRNSTLKGE
ncbi:uncharacterized protein G2W53_011668 [Senna tora]|uniref:N-acetyltransferase domain-containing protein n=1 Tax=Senna tora TaxID=362788 RepID=A0A834X2K8_9FABA|nr:uncharacterized protein G2W53_011668 [Senna tora]